MQQSTNQPPAQPVPKSRSTLGDREQAYCKEHFIGVNEQAGWPCGFLALPARTPGSKPVSNRKRGRPEAGTPGGGQGVGGFSRSTAGPRGCGAIRDRSDRVARSRTWEGKRPAPALLAEPDRPIGDGAGPSKSALDRLDRARERDVSVLSGGADSKSRSLVRVAGSVFVDRPSRLVVERAADWTPDVARGVTRSRSARFRARL